MSIMRIGGMASGMDTDSIVRDLMRVERMKVDRLFQQRQVLDWQKSQFREITNKVRSFRDTFFNLSAPATNLMSQAALHKNQAHSSHPEIAAVTAGSTAVLGESTFQVFQSATSARAHSSSGVTGGDPLNLSDTMGQVNGKILGNFEFDMEGKFNLSINGEEIVIHETDSLQQVIRNINNSQAGVQISYSSFSNTFTVTARETGEGYINTDNGGNFFSALNMEAGPEGTVGQAGRNAIFEINGYRGERSANTFTIDGLTYSIHGKIDEPTEIMTISTSVDVEGIYSLIENFVESYNQLIDELHGKLREERYRDFPPLTDEQKEDMRDIDIERWEEKAQSGLLRREPALENMLRQLRAALYESVGSFHLSEIGIETSSNYRDHGKLVIKNGGRDLKEAIANNPDKVAEIFSRRSDINYSPNLSAEERSQRYSESGLAHRMNDILNDNIRTTRDQNGRKGILLEKAGIEGDLTQHNNFFDRSITDLNKRIDRVNEMLQRKEDQYYRQFTAMEKALQQLYAQGDWLMMQMNQF